MPRPRAASFRLSDSNLALLITAVGFVAVMHAVLTQRDPFAMLPGMDGALTAGVLGFAFGLLHGLRYGDVVRALIPVLGIQIGGCLVHGESIVAIAGMELLLVGLVGLSFVLLRRWAEHEDEPVMEPAGAAT